MRRDTSWHTFALVLSVAMRRYGIPMRPPVSLLFIDTPRMSGRRRRGQFAVGLDMRQELRLAMQRSWRRLEVIMTLKAQKN